VGGEHHPGDALDGRRELPGRGTADHHRDQRGSRSGNPRHRELASGPTTAPGPDTVHTAELGHRVGMGLLGEFIIGRLRPQRVEQVFYSIRCLGQPGIE
jgi:hypothetical protein